MLLATLAIPAQRIRTTNSTTSGGFASKVITATLPSGTGVVTLTTTASGARNGVILSPFGAGSDNQTFDLRVIGWKPAGADSTLIYVPHDLFEGTCTLCTQVGVAGGALVVADRVVDTITAASVFSANSGISYEIVSPTGNRQAHVVIDTKGCALVEVIFNMGTATSGNCLYATV